MKVINGKVDVYNTGANKQYFICDTVVLECDLCQFIHCLFLLVLTMKTPKNNTNIQ